VGAQPLRRRPGRAGRNHRRVARPASTPQSGPSRLSGAGAPAEVSVHHPRPGRPSSPACGECKADSGRTGAEREAVYRQSCCTTQWGPEYGGSPLAAGSACQCAQSRWRGPWSGCRTCRGWARCAREAPGEGSGRLRPPAGCSRSTGRGGRAGRASADGGTPRRADVRRLSRIPGPREQPRPAAGRRLPRGERHQERDRRGGRQARPPGALGTGRAIGRPACPSCFTAGPP
jgi:hypothetical protein